MENRIWNLDAKYKVGRAELDTQKAEIADGSGGLHHGPGCSGTGDRMASDFHLLVEREVNCLKPILDTLEDRPGHLGLDARLGRHLVDSLYAHWVRHGQVHTLRQICNCPKENC